MGLIYQNAVCTIAATCAESANAGVLSKVGREAHRYELESIQRDESLVPNLRYSLGPTALNKRD
jgi:hypothetical protein